MSTVDYACKTKPIVNWLKISVKAWGKVLISDNVEHMERLNANFEATQQQFWFYLLQDQYVALQAASLKNG
jgi:hypothetical protein